jgi:glycosyltransferase involved in cell wall biosynthesis
MSIRIAVLIDIAPRKLGSFEDWIMGFARAGKRRGHIIDVYGRSPIHPDILASLRESGAGWNTLDADGIGSSPLQAIRTLRSYDILHLSFFQPYRRWSYLAALSWPAQVLMLDHYSGPLPGQLTWKSALKNRFRCSPALLRVRGMAGVSEYVTKRDSWLYGLSRSRLRTIYNGVDIQRFSPQDPQRVSGGREAILCVAHLHWIKGVEHLVRAVGRLGDPAVQLSLVGDGPEEAKLRRIVQEENLRDQVHFLGLRNDVPDLVRRAEIFVHPAVWEEAFGLGIAEAMASECAVIASHVGGIPELIEDGVSGLLVPPGDSGALATAIRRLLDDAELRGRLGGAARARVQERFDLDRAVEAHLDWCEETVSR